MGQPTVGVWRSSITTHGGLSVTTIGQLEAWTTLRSSVKCWESPSKSLNSDWSPLSNHMISNSLKFFQSPLNTTTIYSGLYFLQYSLGCIFYSILWAVFSTVSFGLYFSAPMLMDWVEHTLAREQDRSGWTIWNVEETSRALIPVHIEPTAATTADTRRMWELCVLTVSLLLSFCLEY